MVPPEDDFLKDPTNFGPLNFAHLFQLGERLCSENGLTLKDKIQVSPQEVYWITESSNEFFFGNYVLGFFETSERHPFVSLPTILEFKDFIKSAGSTKGLFFSTGYFTKDVLQPLEGPKVSLYNRLKVLEELGRFQIKV